MPTDWKSCRWGEVATLEYGKALRDYTGGIGTYPVYGTNGPIGLHTEPLCKQPSVIIGRKGAYRGVHYSDKPFWVIDTAFYLKPKVPLDTRWAYYQLLTQDINAMDSGSAIPSTSRDDFYSLRLHLPPLEEQLAITSVLGALDDKIQLNRRMNETLEGMARALFQSWFVDFDPVHARMAGRLPFGMDAETAALFPCAFADSPLGSVPGGWEVGRLNDLATIIMGSSPPSETYNDTGKGMPLVNGPVEFGDYFTEKLKWTTSPTRISQEGDLVLCVRGSTTGRRVVADGEYCLGRGVCAIRAKGSWQRFVNELVSYNLEQLLGKTTGSVFPNLSGPDINNFTVIRPPEAVIDNFCSRVSAMIGLVEANIRTNRTLATIRDALLPKLMSGEVRVRDAEKIAEAAL